MDRLELDLIINAAQSANTIGELKTSLREVNRALEGVGADSDEFDKLTLAAGRLKGELGDVKQQIKSLDPDAKMETFGAAVNGVANTFQFAAGAAALFGDENKALTESLIRLQSIMAMTDALKGITGLEKTFKKLWLTISTNPLGAILTAVTAIAAIGGTVYDKYFSVGAQLKSNLDLAHNLYELEKKKLDILNDSENSLRLQGKSEKEILEMKIAQTQSAIDRGIAEYKTQIAVGKEQERIAKKNKELLAGIIKLVTAPITLLLKQIDLIGEGLVKLGAIDTGFGLSEKFSGGIAGLIFDPEETKKKGDETLKTMEEELLRMQNMKAGFQLTIQKTDQDAYKKQQEDFKAHLEELFKMGTENEEKNRKRILDRHRFESELRENAKNERVKQTLEEYERIASVVKARQEEEMQREQMFQDAKLQLQEAYFSAVGGALNLFAAMSGKNKALQNGIFITERALAAAQVFVAGIQERALITANAAKAGGIGLAAAVPLLFASKIRTAVSLASILATTIGKFAGGGASADNVPDPGKLPPLSGGFGGNAAANGININPVPQQSTQLNPDGTFKSDSNATEHIRAYVVETEMTEKQKHIRSLEDKSKIG